MGERFKWTSDKIQLLKQCYAESSWDEIYQILGSNKKASIMAKACQLGLSKDSYNKCHVSQNEIDFIKSHYMDMKPAQIAKVLNRDSTLVYRVMQKYNLTPLNYMLLKPEDESLFINVYPKYTNKYLANKFFPYLNTSQLRSCAKRFHLIKNKDKGVKWYDPEVLLDKLELAIKEHGRVPMLTELQPWNLPSEITFRRYFGGLTKACKMIGIDRTSYTYTIQHNHEVFYDNVGNVCLSLSEVMISNFLIQNDISFVKEALYKEVMPVEECGEKRFDWKINNQYIEFFGLSGYRNYDQKTNTKLNLCKKYNIDLLPLYGEDLQSLNWQDKILKFLHK